MLIKKVSLVFLLTGDLRYTLLTRTQKGGMMCRPTSFLSEVLG